MESGFNQLFCGENAGKNNLWMQDTGWSFIPNSRYDNWLSPKQWYDLVSNHNKFIIDSCEIVVQNMIPLTDNLSISQDTTFMSFNNTIYALAYTDSEYETYQKEIIGKNSILWREGVTFKQGTDKAQLVGRLVLPKYVHYLPQRADASGYEPYTYLAWDPFCKPSSLQELRPGKNAITFGWQRSAEDNDNWASTGFWLGNQNEADGSNVPDIYGLDVNNNSQVLTPYSRSKQDPRNANYYSKKSRTYMHYWHKPIPNFFMKLMPILSTTNTELKQTAQVVIVKTITFEVTPRSGSGNFPQVQRGWITEKYLSGRYGVATPFKENYNMAMRPVDTVGIWPYSAIENAPATSQKVLTQITPAELDSIRRDNKSLVKAYAVREMEEVALPEKVVEAPVNNKV